MKKYERCLVIDDERDLVEVVKDGLEAVFNQVDTAYNGTEALEMLVQNKYELVISDLQMPKMKGDELLKRMRMKGVLTPFIYVTGNGNKEHVVEALRLGAVDFIEKPFDFDELVVKIRRNMDIISEKKTLEKLEMQNGDKAETDPDVEGTRKMLGILQVANQVKHKM